MMYVMGTHVGKKLLRSYAVWLAQRMMTLEYVRTRDIWRDVHHVCAQVIKLTKTHVRMSLTAIKDGWHRCGTRCVRGLQCPQCS
jgi:hypothetical protein